MNNIDFFEYRKDLTVANLLNKKAINLLEILKCKYNKSPVRCKIFMRSAIENLFISRSTFFRYLEGLLSYDLIDREDLGIHKIEGRLVYYKITIKGIQFLEFFIDFFRNGSF